MNATDFWIDCNAKWKPVLICAGFCKSGLSKRRYPEIPLCGCRQTKGEYPSVVEVQQRKVVVVGCCGIPTFGVQYGPLDGTVLSDNLRDVVEASQ